MPARKPEECDTILVDAINKGDLEAAIALYDPNARFVQESGEVVTGHPAIRDEMKGFLALKPKFSIKVTGVQTILFLAGQVPYEMDGTVKHRGDFRGQARAVFAAVKALVEAGGGTLANVVKITTYVTDVRYRLDFRAVRDEAFGAKGPASTMVQVASLSHPDYLIEVEALAVV